MLAPSPNQNQPLPRDHEPAEAFQSGCLPDRSHLQKAFGDAQWGWEFRGSPLSRGNVPISQAALKPCRQRDGDSAGVSPSLCPGLETGARARWVHMTPPTPGIFLLFLRLEVFFDVFSHPQQISVPLSLPSLSLKLREASGAARVGGMVCTTAAWSS